MEIVEWARAPETTTLPPVPIRGGISPRTPQDQMKLVIWPPVQGAPSLDRLNSLVMQLRGRIIL